MKTLFLLLTLIFTGTAHATETPPYKVNDKATAADFNEIYRLMDTHQHRNDGSSRLSWVSLVEISTPTAANTDSGEVGIYTRSGYIVIFKNTAGVMTYLKNPLDGATAGWSVGAP